MKGHRPRQGASLWIDEPGAAEAIAERTADPALQRSASEMLEKGYAVLPAAVPRERCDAAVEAFHGWSAGPARTRSSPSGTPTATCRGW